MRVLKTQFPIQAIIPISSFIGGLLFFILALNVLDKLDLIQEKDDVNSVNFNFTKITKIKQKKNTPLKRARKKKKAKKDLAPKFKNKLAGIQSNFASDLFPVNDLTQDLLGDDSDAAMDINSVDVLPQLTSSADIDYPQDLINEVSGGFVVISMLIGKEGGVQKSRIEESQPLGVFDTHVLKAIKNWKFQPAKYKGKKVAIWVKQKINFGDIP